MPERSQSRDLAGKTALVTGAASGFGLGIATAFADAGATVGLLDLNGDAAETAAQAMQGRAIALQADVTRQGDIEHALQTLARFSDAPLSIVVNNAGLGLSPQPLESVSEEDFDRIVAVNMKSIFNMAACVVPQMKPSGGAMLNIASTAGVSPRPNLTWYNASKGWVITATRSMAVELAPHNIRVNAINPVAGDTPMLGTFLGEDTPERRAEFLSTIPLGRFSTPADIGAAAVFLCSDSASLITGVALEVDGGRCV